MLRVHEFDVWSRPGKLLPTDYGKLLQNELWALGVRKDIFLGLDSVPDIADCESLRISLDRGELNPADFEKFCVTNSLPVDVKNIDSACRFLEFSLGRCIAWLHIPEDSESQLLPYLSDMLINKGLVVIEASSD